MRKDKFSLFFYCLTLLTLSVFLFSCAQVVSPTGGEQDVIPPKVVKSIPNNSSTNFKGKKIQIFFNEYITLKDINSQLIISPPLKKIPEVKVKSKTLTIELRYVKTQYYLYFQFWKCDCGLHRSKCLR